MQQQPEITFHNLEPTPALRNEIDERIAKLERLYDRLVGIRVSVEALHNQHRTGNVYECHIQLMVPGPDLVVSKKPHKAKERYANPDVHNSVRDAFRAAERQLKDFKRQQGGEVKHHEPLFQGQVAELHPEEDYGYLLTKEGALLYFHRNALIDDDLDDLERGDVVHYVQGEGEAGPTAVKVWIGPEHDLDRA